MAIRLFLDRDHAKAGDNPAAGLGKILRESPMMAISKDSGDGMGETTEVGEGGEENRALGEAEGRSKVRGAWKPIGDLLVFPIPAKGNVGVSPFPSVHAD